MCNLYSNLTAHEAMTGLFSARSTIEPNANPPRLAVFPKNKAAVVALTESGQREIRYYQWGFLLPQKSKRTGKFIKPRAVINARRETICQSYFWCESFRKRRCLVPATAYCESTGRSPAIYNWFGVKNREEQPTHFAFAGVYKTFQGEQYGGGPFDTFTIGTTTPNDFAKKFHNRMPVILESGDYDQWLSGTDEEAAALLGPCDSSSMFLIAQGEGLKVCPIKFDSLHEQVHNS